ncbi:MAG: hypothetical protein R2699_11415 [Acidimicrobiales bacterium]|nr:hypothetical protein [Acidimicrobiales bacterium]
MEPGEARQLWHLLETIHAVTYFSPTCRQGHADLGFAGFWMGYFGTRAAPLGPVPPELVAATFYGFHGSMVERAIPDAWDHVAPADAVEGRAAVAATALRELVEPIEAVAEDIVTILDPALETADLGGRPLAAANVAIGPLEEPVADLWQVTTTLREHRGDGHVAVLVAEGIGGCESHVLFGAEAGLPPELYLESRGWPEQEWQDAIEVLTAAGLLADGALTERGARLRAHVEQRTDELAAAPYAAIRPERRAQLLDLLVPVAGSIVEAGIIRYPNPMGLPEVA